MPVNRRIEQIFHEVVSCPPGERTAALARLCGSDGSLRADVESLLRADADSASLAPLALGAEFPPDANGREAALIDAALAQAEPPTHELDASARPGGVVGRYRLLQEIGQGGFGVVFMAEQREPVVRKVALKIIK